MPTTPTPITSPMFHTGATTKAMPTLTVHPGREAPIEELRDLPALDGMNALFVIDLLSDMAMHDRCSRHLHLSLAGRSSNPVLQRKYASLATDAEQNIAATETLMAELGADPGYVSPSARATEKVDSALLESTFLLGGSVDVMTQELVMLDAVLLAAARADAAWSRLRDLIPSFPEGPAREAVQQAADQVHPEEADRPELPPPRRPRAVGRRARTRRLHDPAMELEDVLPVDLVILSHHHGDHWDHVADDLIPHDVPIFTTAHAARKLQRSGFRAVTELETWEQAEVARDGTRLVITALPGKHAPQPLQSLLPPVMGSMLDIEVAGASYRIYVSGDTLLHDRLHEIPERYPDVDLALVQLGGTKVLGVLLTMDGEQGAAALQIIDPTDAIPIHYEESTVMRSPLADFERAVAGRALRTTVHRLERDDHFDFVLGR